jgi:methylmalonyl-CoA mutase
LQGSYFVQHLTDLVEDAVMEEFLRLNDRGGVLGAMETQYQRGQIQQQSLDYEHQKHDGRLPIIGVNTFLPADDENMLSDVAEITRASSEEKQTQLDHLASFQRTHADETEEALERLKVVARSGGNIFEELMGTVRHASLGQITGALYEVGGKYRRNL